MVAPAPPLVLLLFLGCAASPSAPRGSSSSSSSSSSSLQGRRLVCWEAMMQCREEPDCSYAFSQYTEACAPVLAAATGAGGLEPSASSNSNNNNHNRRRCPSHCISALIQLNQTRRGPALEDCDCTQDERCRATKRAIEPCLPRVGAGHGAGAGGGNGNGNAMMGCMEARRRCEWDSRCNLALNRYLARCGKLFNGLRCTEECRAVIQDMLAVPKALLLNDCVCDGQERPICESVKENMARLCFGGGGHGSSGASDGAWPGAFDDDDYVDEDYGDEDAPPPPPRNGEEEEGQQQQQPPRKHGASGGGRGGGRAMAPWTLLACLAPLLLLAS